MLYVCVYVYMYVHIYIYIYIFFFFVYILLYVYQSAKFYIFRNHEGTWPNMRTTEFASSCSLANVRFTDGIMKIQEISLRIS